MMWNMYKSSLCRFLIDKFAGKNLFAALESAQLRILDAKHDAYLDSDLLFILMAAPPSVSLSVCQSICLAVRPCVMLNLIRSIIIYLCLPQQRRLDARSHSWCGTRTPKGGRGVCAGHKLTATTTPGWEDSATFGYGSWCIRVVGRVNNTSTAEHIKHTPCCVRCTPHVSQCCTDSVCDCASASASTCACACAFTCLLVRPQSEMAEMLLHTKRTLWPHVALFAAGNEPSTHFALQIAIN